MERDCHNCARPGTPDGVCLLSSKDTKTCLDNPSRPFWQPAKTDKDKLDEFILTGKETCPVEKDPYPKDPYPLEYDPYHSLHQVLMDAQSQASQGKGKERHADNNSYEDQVICVVGRLLKGHPFGAHAFQVIKKTIEAGRLYKLKGPDAAYNEILGVINYAAAMNILIKEKD